MCRVFGMVTQCEKDTVNSRLFGLMKGGGDNMHEKSKQTRI